MLTPNDGAKRRPVDALFGDSASPSTTNYVVEPPQPSTTVTPPPLETTTDSEPARESRDTLTFAPEEIDDTPLPTFSSTNVTPSFTSSLQPEDPRFLSLSFQIERLYDDVKTELRASPQTTNACFDLLLQARQAYERGDYALAEFNIQATDAKLKRSAKSVQASRHPRMVLLWVWEIAALLIGVTIIALAYVPGLTLFGLPIAAEFLILLRALGWGMLGGVAGTLYLLPRAVQLREYDPAHNMHYFARPLMGMVIGAVLFAFSQAGIIAGNLVVGDVRVGPIFLYVFAALAGFKLEYVTEFLDSLMKTIFRRQTSVK